MGESMSESNAAAREVDFYRKLRKTVKIWAGGDKGRASRYADYVLAAPDLFMLMANLARDERVSRQDRAKLAGAVTYFVNPLDFVPEALLGPAGLVDDVALAGYILYDLLEKVDPTIIQEQWHGEADILDLTRQILAVADTMVGGTIWRRLISRVESFAPRF
jgi:uncharacterized membrane protein YkvA (DUF1232 family)